MKRLLTCMAFGMAALATQAITPLWLRDVQISPDGATIAFGYKGDIYTVDAKGGKESCHSCGGTCTCGGSGNADEKLVSEITKKVMAQLGL